MYMAQAYASQKEGGQVPADSEEARAFKEAMENAASQID
jgi:hypothetical protein